MTRKDYTLIASILNRALQTARHASDADALVIGATVRNIMEAYCLAAGNDNARFDRERFVAAVRGE